MNLNIAFQTFTIVRANTTKILQNLTTVSYPTTVSYSISLLSDTYCMPFSIRDLYADLPGRFSGLLTVLSHDLQHMV